MLIVAPQLRSSTNCRKSSNRYMPLNPSEPAILEFETLNPLQLSEWKGITVQGEGPIEIAVKRDQTPMEFREGAWRASGQLVFDQFAKFCTGFATWWGPLTLVLRLPPGAQLQELRVAYETGGSYLAYLLQSALVQHFQISCSVAEWLQGSTDGSITLQTPFEIIQSAKIVAPATGGMQWACTLQDGRIIPTAALVPGQDYQAIATITPPVEAVIGPWQISALPCICLRPVRDINVRKVRLTSNVQTSATEANISQTLMTYDLVAQVQALGQTFGQADQIAAALYQKAEAGVIEMPAFGVRQGIWPIGPIQQGSTPQDGIQIFSRSFEILLPNLIGAHQDFQAEMVTAMNLENISPSLAEN